MSGSNQLVVYASAARTRAASPKAGNTVARFPSVAIRVYVSLSDSLRTAGLEALFKDHTGIQIVVDDATDAPAGMGWLDPTVQVAVIGAKPGNSTPKLVASMHLARPNLHVIVMSPTAGEEAILTTLTLGVKGFLHDSATAAEFEKAVRAVASGCIWASRRLQSKLIERLLSTRDAGPAAVTASFTKREQQVLDLLLDGRSNREIAKSLEIEERTVKAYVAKLMAKVGVKNRTALSMRTISSEGLGST